jgi:asparagine synthase (glutamine-hydrolysing)
MAWGLEARVPFLDKSFLEVSMNIDAKEKMFAKGASQVVDADGRPKMEKYILRKAFDCAPEGKAYLPDSILWRQKEQFSDGVGYSWIDGMKDHAAAAVSDEEFAKREEKYPVATPDTKEAYWIREIFEGHFPSEAAAKTAVRYVPLVLLFNEVKEVRGRDEEGMESHDWIAASKEQGWVSEANTMGRKKS